MKHLFSLVFLSITLTFYSQNTLKNLEYSSRFEKEVLSKVLNNEEYKTENLYLAIDYDSTQHQTVLAQLEKIKSNLDRRGLSSKKNKKKVKEIVKYVSSNFLKSYELKATLCNLLLSKQYNTTSACALYSLIFDHYNIPYTINDMDNNEYLTVFSEGKEIVVQANKNFKTIQTYDSSFKNNFVQYVKDNKLFSNGIDENSDDETIFSTFYTNKKVISKLDLSAVQYFNIASNFINKADYRNALIYSEKAYHLSSQESIAYNHYMLLATTINNDLNLKKHDPVLFGKFLNLNSNIEFEKTNIQNHVIEISNKYLIQNQNQEAFESFFSSFKETVDPELINFSPFQESYHYQFANFHYYKGEYEKTIEHLSEALIINPKNLESRNNLEVSINRLISTTTNDDEIIEKYNQFFDQFTFIQESNYHQLNYTRVFLKKIYNAYNINQIAEGEKNIKNFKNLLLQFPNIKYDENLIESAFLTAASKYDRKINKAINILTTALVYAPNSKVISNSIEQLKTYKKSKNTKYDYDYLVEEKTFTEKIIDYFKSCWSVTTIEKVGIEINKEENILEFTLEIDKSKYKTAYLKSDDKKIECEWSIRHNSKLLYLIPKNDRSNYFVYKINDIEENELVLRPFVKGKMTNRVLTLTKCK